MIIYNLASSQEHQEQKAKRPLVVTHASRDDLFLGFLAHHQKAVASQSLGADEEPRDEDWAGAMVLGCGTSANFPDLSGEPKREECEPMSYLTKMAAEVNAPVLLTKLGTFDALETITSFTAKHNIRDRARLRAAIEHYEPQIDFDALLGAVGRAGG